MKLSIRILILMAALTLGALSASAQGDAKAGADHWMKYTCYGCHGFSGQNGPGMRLVPMKMTVENFTKMVRNPSAPNRMPPYSEKNLTDAQVANIWAYLKTLPDAPPAKDIPLLQQIIGEQK
ncbi:MAG TPA: cytochrome c [Bryobacteraceae bacterium]|nr:cytochrome c [Bryobacteraceae bacterium]